MNYCSACGHSLIQKIPEGDDRIRYVCEHCHTIHYQNPRIVSGSIPVWDGQVLLCRRAIAPRQGYWTLPAGFMENNETMAEAAARETWEEATARIEALQLFSLMDLPHISQVHVFFRAQLTAPEFAAGAESLETALFDEEDVPWSTLAFPTVERTLKYFFQERRQGSFSVHNETVGPISITKT